MKQKETVEERRRQERIRGREGREGRRERRREGRSEGRIEGNRRNK